MSEIVKKKSLKQSILEKEFFLMEITEPEVSVESHSRGSFRLQ